MVDFLLAEDWQGAVKTPATALVYNLLKSSISHNIASFQT